MAIRNQYALHESFRHCCIIKIFNNMCLSCRSQVEKWKWKPTSTGQLVVRESAILCASLAGVKWKNGSGNPPPQVDLLSGNQQSTMSVSPDSDIYSRLSLEWSCIYNFRNKLCSLPIHLFTCICQ